MVTFLSALENRPALGFPAPRGGPGKGGFLHLLEDSSLNDFLPTPLPVFTTSPYCFSRVKTDLGSMKSWVIMTMNQSLWDSASGVCASSPNDQYPRATPVHRLSLNIFHSNWDRIYKDLAPSGWQHPECRMGLRDTAREGEKGQVKSKRGRTMVADGERGWAGGGGR